MFPTSATSGAPGRLEPLPDPSALRVRDERLRAMKDLVGQVAHAFNNSLAPLAGYMTLIRDELPPGVAREQYLAKMEASLERSQEFIGAIFEATHLERQFLPQWIDFTGLLERTTEAWMKALPVSAQITVDTDLEPCMLCVDERQWRNVFHHLLRNAEHALTTGGTLKLALHRGTLMPSEQVEWGLSTAKIVELRFQDTGCGMPEEALARAFDPLFTTWGRSAGGGLGLTLVHSVVQLQGGQVALESREGAGTRVTIWLPDSGA